MSSTDPSRAYLLRYTVHLSEGSPSGSEVRRDFAALEPEEFSRLAKVGMTLAADRHLIAGFDPDLPAPTIAAAERVLHQALEREPIEIAPELVAALERDGRLIAFEQY